LISGTEKVFFIVLGESTMAALCRTEDTEVPAAAAGPHRENVWRRDGGGGGGGGEMEEDPVM